MRFKKPASKFRQQRQRNCRPKMRGLVGRVALRCETLESRLLLDASGLSPGDAPIADPSNPFSPLELGVIAGRVWEDLDGNRQLNGDEKGMGNVTVYSDLNFNGTLDEHEPFTVTQFDDLSPDNIDKGGLYKLENLQPGYHNIRQVVPSGFEQTFPSLPSGYLPPPWGDPSVHVVFVETGQTVDNVDFGNKEKRIEPGSISGVKWEDSNGNAEFDPGEHGLAGVTIYADLNNNGRLDSDEPSDVTSADIPETDFDEGGRYTLAGLEPGIYTVREVVPDGFRQTYPLIPSPLPEGTSNDGSADQFATVEPGRIDLNLAPGDIETVSVSITVLPNVFVPINIDVVASPATGDVINVTGPQLNGGGGETSTFEIHIHAGGGSYNGDLQFIDLAGGNAIASIPLTINHPPSGDGAHRVAVRSGQAVEGIHFGNQRTDTGPGWVTGRKWSDLDGDGRRDEGETGLGGVLIYADQNRNGAFDSNEPHTRTTEDNPTTDFDEAGLYRLQLDAGRHWIAEVVPSGYIQTFPNNAVIAIFPPPPGAHVHEVNLVSGQTVEGLHFGNRPVENGSVGGRKWLDRNGNRERDPGEPGWGGVTIYADLNFNGRLDAGEPSTFTMEDDPVTDFDEAGLYVLETRPGFQAIREIVPDGSYQTYPVSDALSPLEEGAHFVTVEAGQHIDGLDFGNQQLDAFPASVSGRKWEDLNANGVMDGPDHGLGGVTIYSDLNYNGKLDADEPHTVSRYDDPFTDFDEGGLYTLSDLSPGVHVIREVVPFGFVQTYPSPVLAIPNSDAHTVHLGIGEFVDGLDFGNYRSEVPPPGDLNGDGVVDEKDLQYWQELYGTPDSGATNEHPAMDGRSFLEWQRNLGTAASTSASAALAVDTTINGSDASELPAVDLSGSPLGRAQRRSQMDSSLREEAVREVFAEGSRSSWRPLQVGSSLLDQTEDAPSQRWRGSSNNQQSDSAASEAFDAAIESAFGG